jgi:hypothetical protein
MTFIDAQMCVDGIKHRLQFAGREGAIGAHAPQDVN